MSYVHWPNGWPGGRLLKIIMVLVITHLVVSFVTMIVFHAYARCLYTASHVIGLSLVVCFLVLTHHCTEIQNMIGIPKTVFQKWQVGCFYESLTVLSMVCIQDCLSED